MEKVKGTKLIVNSITERQKDGVVFFISEKEKAPLPKSGVVVGVGDEIDNILIDDVVYFDHHKTKDFRSGFLVLDKKDVKLLYRE